MDNHVQELTGATVKRLYMDQTYLKFKTDKGDYCFAVRGDCCSSSYFWDFLGVKHLLSGHPIVKVEQVYLDDPTDANAQSGDVVQAYGYRFVVDTPEFGEVTALMSFRNDSNGYYGGWMQDASSVPADLPEVTDDVLEAGI